MGVEALIGGVAQAFIGGSAAKKAAKAQQRAAEQAAAIQQQQYEQSRTDMMPWLEAGRTSLADLQRELGSSYEASKGYDWQVKEGEKGVMSNLSALGMTNSGQALKSLTQYRMGLANQDYGTWYNRKAALTGGGQQQSSAMANLGQNYATQQGNNYNMAGAAKASGYVGQANAINQGIGQVSSALGYGSTQPQSLFAPKTGASISPVNYANMQRGLGGLY